MLHDLDAPPELLFDPRLPAAGVALIHPGMRELGDCSAAPVTRSGTVARPRMAALCTQARKTRLCVSTNKCRLRPVIFLAPS
jgi:hypothetical protein